MSDFITQPTPSADPPPAAPAPSSAMHRIFIGKEADYRNPEQTVNVLKFAQAQPANS